MTKLEKLAQSQEREDLIDGTGHADLLRAAQAVIDAASVYVSQPSVPEHHWRCMRYHYRASADTCTCGATALFTALAALRAAEAKDKS